MCVSPVMDCFNGEIVALEMRNNMKKEMCIDTVKQLETADLIPKKKAHFSLHFCKNMIAFVDAEVFLHPKFKM